MAETHKWSLPDPKDLPKVVKPPREKKAWVRRPTMETAPSIRHFFVAGKLPPGTKDIQNRCNAMRRMLEEAVIDAKGSVSITDASCINSAIRWERHGQLCNRWLLVNHANMSHLDKMKFSRETADASDKRDKSIRLLGLDRDAIQDAWSCIDGTTDEEVASA